MNNEIRQMNRKNSFNEFLKSTFKKLRKLIIVILIFTIIITATRIFINNQVSKAESEFEDAILRGDHSTITENIYSLIEGEYFLTALGKLDKVYSSKNFDTIYSDYMNNVEPQFYMHISKDTIESSFTEVFKVDNIKNGDKNVYVNVVNKSTVPVMYTLSITYQGKPTTFWNYKIEDDFIEASLPEFKAKFTYNEVKSGDYLIEIKDERLDKVYFAETITVE